MEEETLANLNDLDIPDEQLFHPPPEVWPVEWLAEAKAGPKDLGETPVDETAPFRSADLWCPPLYCVFEGSIKCLKLWPAVSNLIIPPYLACCRSTFLCQPESLPLTHDSMLPKPEGSLGSLEKEITD